MTHELIEPAAMNPILASTDWPGQVNAVFNPAATSFGGETLLLVRVEDRRGLSHLTVASSADGISNWQVADQPLMVPGEPEHPEEQWGVEDPRITFLEEEQRYAIVYCAYSPQGPQVAMALTEDFKTVNRQGTMLPPPNKDAALFPKRFNGRWALIHRPVTSTTSDIWISFSPDLRHWGDHQPIIQAHSGSWWDAGKIGLCTPPLATPEGWLITYHGVRNTCFGSIYRVGAALLDLDDPTRVISRSHEWLLGPNEAAARTGDVGNVVFPCGWVADGDQLRMYYGLADTSVGLATASIKALLQSLGRS